MKTGLKMPLIGMLMLLFSIQPATAVDWWPMFHHDLSNTGYSTSKAPHTNNIIWSYTTGGSVFSSPVVADGKAYVGSYDHKVYCLDANPSDGVDEGHDDPYGVDYDLIWSYTTGDVVYHSSPAVADGKVYVGSYDHKVYCLRASDGNKEWDFTTGGSITSSPGVADGRVYVGSWDNKVYCLRASDGNEEWSYTTGGGVHSSPAVTDGKVYVGSYDHKMYCLDADPSDGVDEGYDDPYGVDYDLIWSYTAGDSISSSPSIADGKVYVGSYDHKVYCLDADPSDGVDEGYDDPEGVDYDLIWSYTAGDSVSSSPAIANGKVYVGSYDDKVYCLSAWDGSVEWEFTIDDRVTSSPAVADGKVYVGSWDNKVYCLPQEDPNDDGSIDTSEVIWSYTTGGSVHSSPAIADGKVYVGSVNGKIYSFGPHDSDFDGVPDDGDNSGTSGDTPCPGGQIEDCDDNCLGIPNGPDRGTCSQGTHLGNPCTIAGNNESECGMSGFCSKDQEDGDEDGLGNVCDNCPDDVNPHQEDFDGDGLGDLCDPDDDDDGITDVEDDCPYDPNNDIDSDDICGDSDNCPSTYNPDQGDAYPPQGNGIGDACECEADFDCDGDVKDGDIPKFKASMGRSALYKPCAICITGSSTTHPATNACQSDADCGIGGECGPDPLDPCHGDFDCDGDVKDGDILLFKSDMGRSPLYRPCPPCSIGDWCVDD